MKKLLLFSWIVFITFFSAYGVPENLNDDFVMEHWAKIVASKQKQIEHFKQLAKTIDGEVNKDVKSLFEDKQSCEIRLEQLKFNLITNLYSPYSFRLTVKEICEVSLDFENEINKTKTDLDQLDYIISILDAIDESLSSLLKKNFPNELKEMLSKTYDDCSYIRSEFGLARNRLNAEFTNADNYRKSLFKELYQFRDFTIGQFRDYYLSPSFSLFGVKSWLLMNYLMQDWGTNISQKISPSYFINQEMAVVVVISLLFIVTLYYTGRSMIRKRIRRDDVRYRLFVRGNLLILVAIAIAFSTLFIEQPSSNYFFNMVAVLVVIRGIMYFSWGFRCEKEDKNLPPCPFTPLYWLYVFGILLQFIDLFHTIISVLWFIGCFVVIGPLYRHWKQNYTAIEKTLLIISVILCVISLIAIVFDLVYLAILIILAWFLSSLGIHLGIYINNVFKKFIASLGEGSFSFFKIIIIGMCVPVIWLIVILGILAWLCIQTFGTMFFVTTINTDVQLFGTHIHLTYLGFAIYLFFVFKTVSNLSKIAIRKLSETSRIEPGAAPSIILLTKYAVWCLYFVLLLYLLNVNLTNIAVITGGVSVGLGFGLKDIINNFVSGIIILGSHTIRQGDIIELEGVTGVVRKITIRSTVIETFENAVVCFPNANIISNKLINWTNNNNIVRKSIVVGVAMNSDIDKIKQILLTIADEDPHVLSKPAPVVIFDSYAKTSMMFVLQIWIDDINYSSSVPSGIREKINTRFRENNIEILLPT